MDHFVQAAVLLNESYVKWKEVEFSSGPKIKARPYSALNGSARSPARPYLITAM